MGYSEFRAMVKRAAGQLVQRRRVREYVRNHTLRLLNIGSGYNCIDGWLNVDLTGGLKGPVFMDAARPFPLTTSSFDAVLAEHMIEHVPKPLALNIVAESFRILKSGGKIRVITPDIAIASELLINKNDLRVRTYCDFVRSFSKNPEMTTPDIINAMFQNYGHRHIFSIEELEGILLGAGFVDVQVGRGGYPRDPVFAGAEGHPGFMGFENNAFEAFALEASKP